MVLEKGKEYSANAAIKKAIETRNKHQWVVKTDITKFFDNIPRDLLKKNLRTKLKNSSLIPLIEKIIDCELKTSTDPKTKEAIKSCGIKVNIGLRQGMPLSPLLSNLLLHKFDKKAKKYNILRYADDIIAFTDNKSEAEIVFSFIQSELKKLYQTVPSIGKNNKSEIIQPNEPVPSF